MDAQVGELEADTEGRRLSSIQAAAARVYPSGSLIFLKVA